MPIEIPIEQPGGTTKPHARGHLVVECKDPKLLEWLKELKKSADPSKGTIDTPPELLADLTERFKDPANPKQAAFNFRVVRIESDMMPIVVAPPQGPGGPVGRADGSSSLAFARPEGSVQWWERFFWRHMSRAAEGFCTIDTALDELRAGA